MKDKRGTNDYNKKRSSNNNNSLNKRKKTYNNSKKNWNTVKQKWKENNKNVFETWLHKIKKRKTNISIRETKRRPNLRMLETKIKKLWNNSLLSSKQDRKKFKREGCNSNNKKSNMQTKSSSSQNYTIKK